MKNSLISGRYLIVRELGRGAGGVSYLVTDTQDADRTKALKILAASQPDSEADDAVSSAFQQECKLLRDLSHPNIARVLEYGDDEGRAYYTSEYVEGDDFVSACQQRNWNAVFSLIVQICWGLDYLHKQKIIHRDLKPENLLVGKIHDADQSLEMESVRLKIIDFGLAMDTAQQSEAMETAGTLGYMAPEVLAGSSYDHRVDLYSLGVLLYELAIGRLPTTKTRNFSEYLEALHHHKVDMEPLQSSDEVPRGVVSLIESLLVQDPKRRLKSARDVIKLLNEAEGESYALSANKTAKTRPKQTAKRSSKAPIKSPKAKTNQAKLDALLELVRGGEQKQAKAYIEATLDDFSGETDAALVEKFYGAAGHVLIEQGSFKDAHALIARLTKHVALSGVNSIERLILTVQLAYREGKLNEAESELAGCPAAQINQASIEQQTRVATYRGLVMQGLKRYEAAVQSFEQGAVLADKSGRKDHQMGLLVNAATLYYDQGQWDRAYGIYIEAEALARASANVPLLATILNNLGNLYIYFGRQAQAEQTLEESLQIAQDQGLSELVAYNQYLLATGEIGKGNREKVAHYLQEALEHAQRLGGSQSMFQARLAEAYFHLSQKDYDSCDEDIRLLREYAEDTNQAAYQLQVDWFEAKLRIADGHYSDHPVSSWLHAVHKDVSERHLPNSLWQVLKDQGDLAKASGDEAQAQEYYETALGVIKDLKGLVPQKYQESFMRDRKKEKIRRSLELLKPADEPETQATSKEASDVSLSFSRWTDINRRLLVQFDIDQLLEEILDTALSITDSERGFVILSDEQALDIRAARNFDKQTLKAEAEQFSYTIARDVMRKGESAASLDAASDERFAAAQSVHALKIRSVLCVPLRLGQRTVGLIYLDNRYRPGVLINEHIEIIEALADQASLTLEHARLHQENKDKIEELQQNKVLIEKLNERLEKDLSDTSSHLDALRESMKREHEEISLRYSYDNIIGKSVGIKKVLSVVDRVVDTHSPVFIYGDSGTGKELIARAFHFNGPRKGGPFIAENCAALADNLLESELFGHVRGAFTGAEKDRIGLFQMAHRGTLFLDEVGDMSLAMQAKLLRVLQEREVRKVGGRDYQKVDVRVIAASHKDIRNMIASKEFRQDLYYRLNVVRVDLPALKDRGEDVLILADHFLEQQAQELGKRKPRLSKGAIRVLLDYNWPGNIRELQNEMQRLMILGADVISPSQLSPQLIEGVQAQKQRVKSGGLEAIIAPIEKQAILEALERCRGNKVKAAQLLKIGRRTLYMKFKEYGISPHWGKAAKMV